MLASGSKVNHVRQPTDGSKTARSYKVQSSRLDGDKTVNSRKLEKIPNWALYVTCSLCTDSFPNICENLKNLQNFCESMRRDVF